MRLDLFCCPITLTIVVYMFKVNSWKPMEIPRLYLLVLGWFWLPSLLFEKSWMFKLHVFTWFWLVFMSSIDRLDWYLCLTKSYLFSGLTTAEVERTKNEQTMPYCSRNSSINICTSENATPPKKRKKKKRQVFLADLRPAHAAHLVVRGLVHF